MIVSDVEPQEFASIFRQVPEERVASVENQFRIESFRILESSDGAAN